MSDLISRQDAITIPVMPKEHRHYQTNNLDDAYDQGWFDLQNCIEQLPSAQPYTDEEIQTMQDLEQAQFEKVYQLGYEEGKKDAEPERKWIPCSERLPDIDGEYLCCYGNRIHIGQMIDKHFRHYGEIADHLITAWMPLPEPWEGETE